MNRLKPLNFAVDFYVAKYPRSRLLWVDKNEIAEWMLRGAKIVPLDPLEYSETQIRIRRKPGSIHVQHLEGTTLFRMSPRLYDRHRLAPTRKRNRAIRAVLHPKWWTRWYRIKSWFRSKRRRKEEQLDFWDKVSPAPPLYFEANARKLHAIGFDVDESEVAFTKAKQEHLQ